MKNKLTRKLMLSAFTLLFAVISLGASTYAWFTMSNSANIEAFTADVKAGQGIEIAVTSGSEVGNAQWYTGTVPADVVQAAANPLDQNKKTTFRFDAATTKDSAATIIDKANNPSTGYVQFYIHIKTAETGAILLDGITLDSKKDGADITPWTADAAYQLNNSKKVSVNEEVLYEVENAARIAFIVSGNAKIYEKDTVNGSEKTYEVTDESGATITKNYYDAGNQTGCPTVNGSFDYYNQKSSVDLKVSDVSTYETKIIESTFTPETMQQTLSAGQTLTIQVKVWIEGWDAECLNAIFSQTLSVAISFKFEIAS